MLKLTQDSSREQREYNNKKQQTKCGEFPVRYLRHHKSKVLVSEHNGSQVKVTENFNGEILCFRGIGFWIL